MAARPERYTVSVTHPQGVPHLNIEVPDDMSLEDRFAVLRMVAAKHKSILAGDALGRGNVKGESLSTLLARRKAL